MQNVLYLALDPDGHTGYSLAGAAYRRALREAGVSLTFIPMVEGRAWGLYFEPRPVTLPPDPGLLLIHMVPEFYDKAIETIPHRKVIAITVWESDQVSPGRVAALNCVDGLVVPCEWNRRAFVNAGVKPPVHVAPHVYFEFDGKPEPLDHPLIRKEDTVFYSIGTWGDRKGMRLLVEAFCRAFHATDNAVLVIKTGNVNEYGRQWGHLWWHLTRRIDSAAKDMVRIRNRHANPPRIVVIPEPWSEAQMEGLHQRGDCYVSMSRAEGWGLGAYEAAFHAKPVIMPRHGGQADFLPEDACYPVPHRIVPAKPVGAIDEEAFSSGQTWAEPDLDHAAVLMRSVLDKLPDSRGAALRRHVEQTFQPPVVARGLVEFFESVLK